MSLQSLPRRAVRSIHHHGFRHTWNAGKYRFKKHSSLKLYRSLVERADLLDRVTLREQAVFEHPTDTDTIPYKGASGLPDRCPQNRYDPGPRFVAELEDAAVVGRRGLVVDEQHRIAVDPVGPPIIVPRRPALALQGAVQSVGLRDTRAVLAGDRPDRTLTGPVAHVLPPFRNYYHWLVECIPRLRLLERYGERTGTYPTLLLPEDRTEWMDAIFDEFGYRGDTIRWHHDAATAERLIVPTFPDPVAEDCAWLAERLGVDGTTGDRRLFVTREDTINRRVANRMQVRQALDPLGFEAVCPGRYSVREQARMFAEADIIVGPHGAGLTNVLFGNDATVIECTGEKAIATYARLSELRNHDYHRLDCASDPAGDIVVDTERLREVIETHD